ncbi:MAG: aspartyl protease family protein [Thermoanaerobaculia bacterium]
MKIRLAGGLPYVTASLQHRGQRLTLEHVVLDTGSGASVFAADELLGLGILPEPEDPLHRILGVGGSEFVFSKRLDGLALGDLEVSGFEVQVGAMDYGFPIQGILGMDFLLAVKAVIDLDRLEISRA